MGESLDHAEANGLDEELNAQRGMKHQVFEPIDKELIELYEEIEKIKEDCKTISEKIKEGDELAESFSDDFFRDIQVHMSDDESYKIILAGIAGFPCAQTFLAEIDLKQIKSFERVHKYTEKIHNIKIYQEDFDRLEKIREKITMPLGKKYSNAELINILLDIIDKDAYFADYDDYEEKSD